MHCLSNFPEQARAGFDVNFASARKRAWSPAALENENALARQLLRAVVCLLAERTSSMMLHIDHYPLSLAGLLSESADLRAHALDRFRADWDAFAKMKTLGMPELEKLIADSPMSTRVMQDFACLMRVPGDGLALLQARVKLAFETWGQENIVENSFQRLRDRETRDASSKTMKGWKAWEVLQHSGLMESFGRPQVQITSTADVPADMDNESLFTRIEKSPTHDELNEVVKKQDWSTWNAQSLKNGPADIALVRQMHTLDNWALVADAWHAQLVPLHQLILQKKAENQPPALFFSIFVANHAVLGWPVRRIGKNCISLATDGAKPSWHCFFTVADVEVVPTEGRSPVQRSTLRRCTALRCQSALGARPCTRLDGLAGRARFCWLHREHLAEGSRFGLQGRGARCR